MFCALKNNIHLYTFFEQRIKKFKKVAEQIETCFYVRAFEN
ncbi:hypothetical protein JCM19301_1365 [Jejuia pallidilutea]|jgi:hypothetical protein|uniref:Uncharacterized protein n=1 Tax=Jejuia pallidilutea TaxID=504487 RepID=A0A090W4K8_9FLAO|nr:hypothetical protein JCM19301_1365 [Jejuia pallidilutea]GAL70389.1 hypothetical protein JCM19302_3511 [Jejuia pallidilutea]GAL90466.1 hypothetical protein JCM19538_231 [Jejuia pallidilutea]